MSIIDPELTAVVADDPVIELRRFAIKLGESLWVLWLFVAVFSAHLAHHLLFEHAKVTFGYDSHYYLFTCSQIIQYIQAAIHGQFDWVAFSRPSFVSDIVRDGPITPGLPAVLLFWLGRDLVASDWRIFVVLLSILQSISACLVGLICRRITGVTWAGITAGLLFGLYPGSLVASGLYFSENIVVLLELTFIFCLGLAANNLVARIISGIMLGMLCMAKPALIPASVIATIIGTFFISIDGKKSFSKQLLLFVSIIAVGVLTVLPWATYTKLTYRKALITAERWPAYNAAVGTDIQTDGWCVYPWTARQNQLNWFSTPSAIMIGQWHDNPVPMLGLMIKRITRLFISPWNNFREKVFGIDPCTQQYIHLVILFLSIFGICAYLLNRNQATGSRARLFGNLCLTMVICHSSYLLFQAMPRYGYTAMPFLIVFGGYGLFYIKENKLSKNVSLAMIMAVLSFVLICKAEALTKIGEPLEISYSIANGMAVEKHIDLSDIKVPEDCRQALLLVDGDDLLNGSQIIINGRSINEPMRLINDYGSEEYKLLKGLRELANLLDNSIVDFRQWRAVPVPISYLNLHGNNFIDIISGAQRAKIFADAKETRRMLSPSYTTPDFMSLSMDSMEARMSEPALAQYINQQSLVKNTKTDSFHPLSTSLRIKLALITKDSHLDKNLRSAHGLDHCLLQFDPRKCDIQAQDPSCGGVHVSRYLLGYVGGVFDSIDVPALNHSSHIAFRITGQYRILRGPGKVAISIKACGPDKQEEILGMTPNYMLGDHSWKSFAIDDLLPTATIGNSLRKIVIGFWPLPWLDAQYGADKECSEAQFKNIQIQLQTRQLPDISLSGVHYY